MSPTETESTRERILAAATAEFAQHGIAGARVERIAKGARTSKERVYAHFGSKDNLYRQVAARELAAMAQAVPLDPANLPDYAGRVHDHGVRNPMRLRLMQWGQLELSPDSAPADDEFQRSIDAKTARIADAIADGLIGPEWEAGDVLTIVSTIATSWALQLGVDEPVSPDFMAERRDAIVRAVERIFPARPSA